MKALDLPDLSNMLLYLIFHSSPEVLVIANSIQKRKEISFSDPITLRLDPENPPLVTCIYPKVAHFQGENQLQICLVLKEFLPF